MSGVVRFRSVNLREDLLDPRRLAHYQPTRRSAPVVRAVLESGARMVIAAYGSGKSLAAGVGCLLVSNSDKAVLRDVVAKMGLVDPDLAITAERRTKQREHGRVIVLSGHVRDLQGALCEAVGAKKGRGIEATLDALEAVEGVDRIAIVWDEFGRHLEGIVNEGRSRELDAVQRLAEWAVRVREPSASLTLLLHQNLLAYATVLNQTSRTMSAVGFQSGQRLRMSLQLRVHGVSGVFDLSVNPLLEEVLAGRCWCICIVPSLLVEVGGAQRDKPEFRLPTGYLVLITL